MRRFSYYPNSEIKGKNKESIKSLVDSIYDYYEWVR